jgi:hypothetical protein
MEILSSRKGTQRGRRESNPRSQQRTTRYTGSWERVTDMNRARPRTQLGRRAAGQGGQADGRNPRTLGGRAAASKQTAGNPRTLGRKGEERPVCECSGRVFSEGRDRLRLWRPTCSYIQRHWPTSSHTTRSKCPHFIGSSPRLQL